MINLDEALNEWRRQRLEAGIRTPAPLNELESHLGEEIDRQLRLGLNEEAAFNSAIQRIGHAQSLKTEFEKVETTKAPNMINHKRLYSTIVTVFAVWSVLSGGLCVFLAGLPAGESLGIHVPRWLLPWLAACYFAYFMAMVATLLARRCLSPNLGRRIRRGS